jgi:N-acetylglucosamine kinase-like BadF-type ATPase
VPDVAKLASIVLEEAEQGDAIAIQIVYEHGKRLGEYAVAAARKVGLQAFYLVLAGSVFKTPSQLFQNAIIDQVRSVMPQITPAQGRYEPVIGALFLALEAGGITITPLVLAAIEQTVPPPHLFTT